MHYSIYRRHSCVAVVLLGAATLFSAYPAHAWAVRTAEGVRPAAVAPGPRGSAFVAGSRRGAGTDSSLYLARYSAAGALEWAAEEAGGTLVQPAAAQAVAVDRRGDVYVTGSAPGVPFAVLKYRGTTGERLWMASVAPSGSPDGGAGSVLVVDSRGMVTVGGYVSINGSPSAVVARLEGQSGARIWTYSAAEGGVRALVLDRSGDVLLTGGCLAAKLSGASGELLWRVDATARGEKGFPQTRSIAVDSSGVVVGGTLRDTFSDRRAFYLARLDAHAGTLRWEVAGDSLPTFEAPSRLAVDRKGNLISAGRLGGAPASLQISPTDGRFRWVRRPWAADDRPDSSIAVTDLALDSTQAYLCGSDGANHFQVAAVSRTGKLRWSHDLGAGRAQAVATANGLLFVVGEMGPAGSGAGVLVTLRTDSGKSPRAKR